MLCNIAAKIHTISHMNNRETTGFLLVYFMLGECISKFRSASCRPLNKNFNLLPFGLHCILSFFSYTQDWVRHRSGQRDHGHPGSGRQPGGHEKQAGTHGGGDQPLWTACHRRGPGVWSFHSESVGNFKLGPDRYIGLPILAYCRYIGIGAYGL